MKPNRSFFLPQIAIRTLLLWAALAGISPSLRAQQPDWQFLGPSDVKQLSLLSHSGTIIRHSSNGDLYAAYETSFPSTITVRRYNPTNQTWVLQGTALEATNDFYFELDNNDVPYLSYRIDASTSKVVKLVANSWQQVGSSSPGNIGPLAFDGSNVPYILINDTSLAEGAFTAKPTVKKLNGGDWVTVGNAGFVDREHSNPSIAINANGVPTVSFFISQFPRIRAFKLNESTWQTLQGSGDGAVVNSGFPSFNSMVLDDEGRPNVVFRDPGAGGKASVRRFRDDNWENLGPAGFSTGGVRHCKIGKSHDGTLYVFYHDAATTGLADKAVVKKWTGTDWVLVGTEGFSPGAALPLSISFHGDIPFVSYKDETLTSQTVVSKFNGTDWERVNEPASFSGGNAASFALASHTDGTKYLAYRDLQSSNKVTVKKWSGTAWQTLGVAGISAGAANSLSLKVASDGVPYVAYVDESEVNKAYVARFNSGSSSWETVGNTSATVGQGTSMQFVLDGDDIPHLSYFGGGLAIRKFNGTAWADVDMTEIEFGSSTYSLAKGADGSVYIAGYLSGVEHGPLINKLTGTGWEQVGGAALTGVSPSNYYLAFDPSNRPLLAYTLTSNDGKVAVKRLENGSWTQIGVDGFSAGAATSVRLLTDAAGFPYIAYADAGNAGKLIIRRWTGSAWNTVAAGEVSESTVTGADISMTPSGELTAAYNTNGLYAKAIKTQAILFGELAPVNPGAEAFSLVASGGASGNPVTFNSSNTSVASVSGSTVAIVGPGTTNITASQAGSSEYLAAIPVVRQLIVKNTQSISFTIGFGKTFGDEPFDLTATGGASGEVVTFASSNEEVATISGNTVSIVGAGTVNITASQAGNNEYIAANDVVRQLVVNKAAQTITFAAIEPKSLSLASFVPGATASSGLDVVYTSSNTSVATVLGASIGLEGIGIAIITATQPGNSNYLPAVSVQRELVVKLSQSITYDSGGGGGSIGKTFGDDPFDLEASATSSLPVSFSVENPTVATISGNTVTIVKAGSTNITISQAGNGTYLPAANVVLNLTVDKGYQTIIFPALSQSTYSYTTTPLEFNITGGPAAPVVLTSSDESVATVSGLSVTFVGLGHVTFTATQAGNDNYRPADPVERSLEVIKANQTIDFPEVTSFSYGGGPLEINLQSSAGLPVAYTSNNEAVVEIVDDKAYFRGAGTATVGATQAGNTLYNAAPSSSVQWVVQKAPLTVTAQAEEITYGDPIPSLSYTYSGFVNSEDATALTSEPTVSTTATGSSDAGEYPITLANGDADNYEFDFVNAVLTINKASQTITIESIAGKFIAAAPFDIQASTTASGAVLTYAVDGPATISGSTVTLTGQPGSVTVTVSQAGNTNYLAASAQTSFNVTDPSLQNQSITFGALAAKTFGDAPFALAGSASSGLSVSYASSNASVATIDGGTLTIVGAGTTTITAMQAGNASYNPASQVQQVLTVSKGNQEITITAIDTKLVTAAAFEVQASVNTALTLVYGVSGPASISGSTITVSGAAGTVTVTVSQAGNGNYNAAEKSIAFEVVNKLNQAIIFEAIAAKAFGTASFDLTATGGASGNPVTFTSGNVAVATISGNTVTIVGAGVATITANQAGSDSYNAAASVEQTLTVNKASQTITFEAIAAKTFGDPAFELAATSSAGLQAGYTSSNEAVATISGSTVTIVGAGTTTITASQAGNGNYEAATGVEQTLTINKASQTITFAEIASQVLSTGSIALGATASSGLAVSYEVTGSASLSGTTLTFTGAGDITVTASQAGNVNYMAASALPRTFTVTDDTPADPVKQDQAITFEAIADKTFGDAAFGLVASASSGLTVSFSVTEGPATIAGSTVTITGAGSVTVTASQAGNDSFNPATEVSQTFIINKATATVTLSDLEQVADGMPKTPTAVTEPAGLEVVFTFDGETIVPVAAGSYAVVATVTDANYQGSAEGTLVLTEPVVETGIDDDGSSMVNVYPNPFEEALKIEGKNLHGIRLHDLSGQLIFAREATEVTELTTTHLMPGVYLLYLLDDRGQSVVKRVIKK